MSQERIRKTVEAAEDIIDSRLKAVEALMSGPTFAAKRASKEELMALWRQKMEEFPPMPMVLETGERVVESPWVLAVKGSANGAEFMRPFRKMFREAEE